MAVKREVREASELGLRPGQWPLTLEIDGVMCWRGGIVRRSAEFISYLYGTIDGRVQYEVLND